MNQTGKGFTLLEAMVAVGIFAILGIVCLENYLINTSIAQRLIDEQTCLILAGKKEFEYLQNPENVPETGDFGETDPQAKYAIETDDITLSETVTIDSEITFNFIVKRIVVQRRGSKISYPILITKSEAEK
ncbi:MAG: type II secretion system GspH family protein [bacterium]|nr:type II secretion system GspH family protein [bacterium]